MKVQNLTKMIRYFPYIGLGSRGRRLMPRAWSEEIPYERAYDATLLKDLARSLITLSFTEEEVARLGDNPEPLLKAYAKRRASAKKVSKAVSRVESQAKTSVKAPSEAAPKAQAKPTKKAGEPKPEKQVEPLKAALKSEAQPKAQPKAAKTKKRTKSAKKKDVPEESPAPASVISEEPNSVDDIRRKMAESAVIESGAQA